MATRKSDTGVRAWVEQMLIPTYERGPEDKNPPLLMDWRNPIHPGSSIIYPYAMQETLFDRKAERSWQAYCLENEYLRVTFLPELGGKILDVFDSYAASRGQQIMVCCGTGFFGSISFCPSGFLVPGTSFTGAGAGTAFSSVFAGGSDGTAFSAGIGCALRLVPLLSNTWW